MNTLFDFSYALLSSIVLLESFILREALRKTVEFKRLYSDFAKTVSWDLLRPGDRAPQFSALSGQLGAVQTSDLAGSPSALVFVSPTTSELRPYKGFASFIHALWHKRDRHLYIVCQGGQGPCVQFVQSHVPGFPLDKTLMDEDGSIARDFRIKTMPHAIELDRDVCVERYGKPDIGDEDEQAVHPDLPHKREWSDREITGAGYARVDTSVSCMLTRFRLRSIFSLLKFYFAFRKVRDASRNIDGLLKALFLVEDLHTCYTLSLWKDDLAIVDFGNVREHIDAANSALGATYRKDLNRLEIWSAQFRLWGVSSHNLSWQGLDLSDAIKKSKTLVED